MGLSVKIDRPPHHVRIAAVAVAPQSIADQNNRLRSRQAFLFAKIPPGLHAQPKHRQQIRRRPSSGNPDRLATISQIESDIPGSSQLLEAAVLLSPIHEIQPAGRLWGTARAVLAIDSP